MPHEERAAAVASDKAHHSEISLLISTVRELSNKLGEQSERDKSRHGSVSKHDLEHSVQKIMTAISQFAASQQTHNDRIDAAVEGLVGDVASLKATIVKFQGTPGTITAEDQKLLDDIQARTESVATKLEALDSLTPPEVPVGPDDPAGPVDPIDPVDDPLPEGASQAQRQAHAARAAARARGQANPTGPGDMRNPRNPVPQSNAQQVQAQEDARRAQVARDLRQGSPGVQNPPVTPLPREDRGYPATSQNG